MTTGGILILITQLITLVTAGLSLWASRRNKAAIQSVQTQPPGAWAVYKKVHWNGRAKNRG